ncbi:hypothetical protein GA0074692_6860 [Micromonospora pallida]|uniref:Uncharacterized protein n=1 Tax=Micromonospora pallida TaxID=145854 RepID=A0A1C6TPB8_9ACTN|nr:hypothetical protein [Micromonospora pallida]SCL43395.1 hypothetical protein GA0074692_6860 [Micromonospora pallida]
MPVVPETKPAWANGIDALNSTNLNAYVRDPLRFLMRKPAAKVRQSVTQSFTSGTWTAVLFGVEDFDTDLDGIGGHSTSSSTSRYTARYPGLYLCGGGISWANNTTGRRGVRWAVNGSSVLGTEVLIQSTAGANVNSVVARTTLIYLDIGDYVELYAMQDSGAALGTAVTADNQPAMSVTWDRMVAS